jgi:hypothetical protein
MTSDTDDIKDIFKKPRRNQNIYYEILPMIISILALFGAFKFLNILTPLLTNILKCMNCYLKNFYNKKRCNNKSSKPKVKQVVVTCTPLK